MWPQNLTSTASYTESLCSPYEKGQVYQIHTPKYQLFQELQDILGWNCGLTNRSFLGWKAWGMRAAIPLLIGWLFMHLGARDCRTCIMRVRENIHSLRLFQSSIFIPCRFKQSFPMITVCVMFSATIWTYVECTTSQPEPQVHFSCDYYRLSGRCM